MVFSQEAPEGKEEEKSTWKSAKAEGTGESRIKPKRKTGRQVQHRREGVAIWFSVILNLVYTQ
jgi:hypothetical protein